MEKPALEDRYEITIARSDPDGVFVARSQNGPESIQGVLFSYLEAL